MGQQWALGVHSVTPYLLAGGHAVSSSGAVVREAAETIARSPRGWGSVGVKTRGGKGGPCRRCDPRLPETASQSACASIVRGHLPWE